MSSKKKKNRIRTHNITFILREDCTDGPYEIAEVQFRCSSDEYQKFSIKALELIQDEYPDYHVVGEKTEHDYHSYQLVCKPHLIKL